MSLETIFINVFLNADRLLPVSIGKGPRFGKVRLRVFIVNVMGFLGLILDRLVFAVLGMLHLENLNMDLGLAMDHVQVARRLDLELLDFKKYDHVGIEVAGGVGRFGPVGMGFHPGCDLIGVDDDDFLTFFLKTEASSRGMSRSSEGNSASAAEFTLHRMTTFFSSREGPFGSIVGSNGWRK